MIVPQLSFDYDVCPLCGDYGPLWDLIDLSDSSLTGQCCDDCVKQVIV